MENVIVKTSNLSEIISKFAKVCKFRSIGVFPDQRPNSKDPCEVETLGDNKGNETEICDFNHKPSRKIRTFCWDDDEILKLFDIVSALKLAYVEFQQAHLPYDPDKIIEADNLVVSQLEALRRMKRLYLKTKQLHAKKTELDAAASSCWDRLRDEIEVNEKHLEKLKAQVKAKESEVYSLKEKLDCLIVENRKLEERIVSVSSFEFVFRAASKSIHDFAKPLITLMKATDWNLDKAVESIVGNVLFARKSDKKYAFESYIVRRMFQGMKLSPCDVTELMSFDDPLDALTAFPDSAFSRFCGQKYLLVVHPSMEASFFGNLDMRGLVLLGKHPRTMFYRIFAKMAKWVWILGSFAASLDLKAKIFVVRRGTRFSGVYMESVVGDEKEEGQGDLSVEFITMPGFKFGDSVFKSQVYLAKTKG
ncbi:Protein GRAVITROPIC IN THE LIGHT 1 [Cardamine amara subsp. amara]|uniref:Protein GRAVITROPIC IN THE LIGHT 1 n=1 Tax=Cardamine amara subsp. amara TaxID=228776 RepID=A0ABD0ZDL0_CARAN